LDHAETRLAYYNRVLDEAIAVETAAGRTSPRSAEYCDPALG
jgi:hypothetical protein